MTDQTMDRTMERHVYGIDSLRGVLQAFEDGYGMSSEDFYLAHVENRDAVQDMSGSHRQAWAGFYAEWQRMDNGSFAGRVKRELELA